MLLSHQLIQSGVLAHNSQSRDNGRGCAATEAAMSLSVSENRTYILLILFCFISGNRSADVFNVARDESHRSILYIIYQFVDKY